MGAIHTEIPVDENCLTYLDAVVRHVGAPVANPAALIASALMAQVGNHVDAAMCGDGGNEIFGGTYKYHQLMRHIASCDGSKPWQAVVRNIGQKAWRYVEDTPFDDMFQRLARRYFATLGQKYPVPLAICKRQSSKKWRATTLR